MAGVGASMKNDAESKALLNTYIHNYLLHEGFPDLAKALRSSNLPVKQESLKKEGSNNQLNGADDDADSKEDNKTRAANEMPGDTFLLDYWFIFWDLWGGSKKDPNKPETLPAQYMMHNQMRQQPMFAQQMMNGGMNGFNNRMMPGVGPQPINLQKNAMNNNAAQRTMNPQQFQRMQGIPPQQQMQREGSDVDVNQRPQSPLSAGENAASPNKRQRLDGPGFQTHMGPQRGIPMNGQIPNGVVGNQEAMMMQGLNGRLHPGDIEKMMGPNKQLMYAQSLSNQQRTAMAGFQQMPNGFQNGAGQQMSPMMGDGGQYDMMAGGQMRNNAAAGNGGALADYQMQLMLLEQQNKKRLMMARQEQDVASHSGMTMGPTGYPSNTSPHGRNGQSPNPDTKRNTPKLGQGSPLPDGTMPQNRGSPAPPNFEQIGVPSFMTQIPKGIGEGMMRPPGSHPMQQNDMMRNGPRLVNGAWQGGPMPGQMMPQGPGGPPNQVDGGQPPQGPGPRGNMPPPQVPATGPGKPQPSPTQQNPPTPTATQTTKGNAKGKKDSKETKKKAPKKSQSTTNAAANTESERPPTPTPQTPATPVAHDAHIIKGPQGPQHQQAQPQPQQPLQANGQLQQQPPNMQLGQGMPSGNNDVPFGSLGDQNDFGFPDFMNDAGPMAGEDANDILGGFDFDTFMSDPSGMNWDADFTLPGDGLETGAGQ